MIKPLTCVCMVLAAGSGLYLYQSKHRAQMLDREIQRTIKQIEVTKERTVQLHGEWALLTESDRLTELSQKHLGLRQLAPSQFTTLAEAASRLPPPVAPGTVIVPPEDMQANAAVSPLRSAAVPAPAQAPAAVQVASAPPVQVAEVRPPPRPAPPRPAPSAAPVAAPPIASAPLPPPAPPAAPRPVLASLVSVAAAPIVSRPVTRPAATGPAPGSIGDAVLRAGVIKAPPAAAPAALPAAIPAAVVPAPYAPPAFVPAAATPSYGSALGGASRAALPPPTPYSAR